MKSRPGPGQTRADRNEAQLRRIKAAGLLPVSIRNTMDIYAKVKYNKPEELSAVVNEAPEK